MNEAQLIRIADGKDAPVRRRPTVAETDNALAQLQEAIEQLAVFTDPSNDDCSVPPQVRQAAQQFLESWVTEPMKVARQILLRSGCGGAYLREKACNPCRYSARHLADAVPAVTILDCGPVGQIPACQRCADFYASQA